MKLTIKERLLNLYFLVYTIIYFHTHKRGLSYNPNNGYTGCSYVNGCAIGIWMSKESRNVMSNYSITKLSSSRLTPFLRRFNINFLDHVQKLHDNQCSFSSYWIGGTNKNVVGKIQFLTKEGWKEVYRIFKIWVLNKP